MKKILLGLAAAAAIFAAASCGGDGSTPETMSKKAKFHYLEKGGDNKVTMTVAEFEIKDGKLMKDGEQATVPTLTDAAEFVLTETLKVNGEDYAKDTKLIVDGIKWYGSEECEDTDSTFDAADPEEGDWYAKYKVDDRKVTVTFKMAKTDGTWANIGDPVEVGADKKVLAASIPTKAALTGDKVITDNTAVELTAELKLGTDETAVPLGLLSGDYVKAALDGGGKLTWTDATKAAVDLAAETFDASADVYVAYERTTFHLTFVYMAAKGTANAEFEVKSTITPMLSGFCKTKSAWLNSSVKAVDLSACVTIEDRGTYTPSEKAYIITAAPATLADFTGVDITNEFKFGAPGTGTPVSADTIVSWKYTKNV